MTKSVHYSGYASQPSIRIDCDDSWGTPAWGPRSGLTDTPNVYELNDGRLYTFEEELVTCEPCKVKAAK